MCEALWSDPQPGNGRSPSKRGIGVSFGPDVTRRFLADNSLDLVVRSHEVGRLLHGPPSCVLSRSDGLVRHIPRPWGLWGHQGCAQNVILTLSVALV